MMLSVFTAHRRSSSASHSFKLHFAVVDSDLTFFSISFGKRRTNERTMIRYVDDADAARYLCDSKWPADHLGCVAVLA